MLKKIYIKLSLFFAAFLFLQTLFLITNVQEVEAAESWRLPYAAPVELYTIQGPAFHGKAIDFVTRPTSTEGTLIVAAKAGTVYLVRQGGIYDNNCYVTSSCSPYGNYVVIKHSNTSYSWYLHMRPGSIEVKEGMAVRRGHPLGRMGNTGNSSGPHLHFQATSSTGYYSQVDVAFENLGILDHLKYYTSNNSYNMSSTFAVFGGKLYQAHVGQNGKIYHRKSGDGVSWGSWATTGDHITSHAVSLTVFKGKLYESHVGLDGKIYMRSTSSGTSWSGWVTTNDHDTNHAIAMESFVNVSGIDRLYQSHIGLDGRIYTRYTSNGTSWSGWTTTEDHENHQAVAMSVFKGKLYQAHTGMNNRIYTRSSADGKNWSGWQTSDSSQVTKYPIAMAKYYSYIGVPDRLLQTRVGIDGKIYTRYSLNGSSWGSWTTTDSDYTEDVVGMIEFNNRLYQSHISAINDIYIRRSNTLGLIPVTWSVIPDTKSL
ncbi:MAG: peptidoglycan DD-metalloendopeptidase family protein [Patescibacteria group bacterium]|nr:M23 family metallopeptidase [Patescibacteria group bacterium]